MFSLKFENRAIFKIDICEKNLLNGSVQKYNPKTN